MKLHHIGIVVQDIYESAKTYERLLGLKVVEDSGEDPIQKVKVVFLGSGEDNQITLELLEPTDPDSPIANALRRGGGLHHLCFEVEDIDEEVRRIKENGGEVVCEPIPACGFDYRRIAFIFPVDNILTELVENGKKL